MFKEEELPKWDNTILLQGWEETQEHFTTIRIDCEVFKRLLPDDCPFDSALAVGGALVGGGHMDSSRPGAWGTACGLTTAFNRRQKWISSTTRCSAPSQKT